MPEGLMEERIAKYGIKLWLHAHAAGGAQRRYYRRSDTCNHLYDELDGFSLTHNLLILTFLNFSIFTLVG